jgi:transposase-like protein
VPHARSRHANAALTPKPRRRMVDCLLERGWTVEMTAERFQIDAKTVRKWRDRFLVEGEAGLQDRSSRPHRSPNRTPARLRRRVCICVASVAGAPSTSRMSSAWRRRPSGDSACGWAESTRSW